MDYNETQIYSYNNNINNDEKKLSCTNINKYANKWRKKDNGI